jgi:hypothetical protein
MADNGHGGVLPCQVIDAWSQELVEGLDLASAIVLVYHYGNDRLLSKNVGVDGLTADGLDPDALLLGSGNEAGGVGEHEDPYAEAVGEIHEDAVLLGARSVRSSAQYEGLVGSMATVIAAIWPSSDEVERVLTVSFGEEFRNFSTFGDLFISDSIIQGAPHVGRNSDNRGPLPLFLKRVDIIDELMTQVEGLSSWRPRSGVPLDEIPFNGSDPALDEDNDCMAGDLETMEALNR